MSILEKIPYDKISEFPNYQRMIAVLVIVLVMFVGYFFLFHKDKAFEISQLSENLNNIEQELNTNRIRQKKLPAIKKKVEKLNLKLLIARTQLPGSKEIPELLEHISNLGRASGLEFLLFRPKATSLKDFYTQVPVEMKVSGTFHNIVRFYDKIGNFTRIVNLSNINIGGAKKISNKTVVNATNTATTFMFTGSEEESKDENKSYLNNKLGFSITHKSKWAMVDKTDTEKTVIFTSNDKKEKYLANIEIKLLNEKISIEQLANEFKSKSKIFKDNFNISNEASPIISKFKTKELTYTYVKNKLKIKESTIFILNENYNKMFMLKVSSLDNVSKKYDPIFTKNISSFWIHTSDDFKKIGQEKFWESTKSSYSSDGKRDPFYSLLTSEEIIIIDNDDEERHRPRTPLEMFDSLSLKLVAIIWDNENKKKALIQTSDGKGFTVRVNTPIGKKRGYVKKITRDSIIIEEKQRYKIGRKIKEKKDTIILKIRSDKRN